jgi:type I restriction enzyme M protein
MARWCLCHRKTGLGSAQGAEGIGFRVAVKREVLPHVPDAWIDESATKIGYEISFQRYFYKPQPLRTLQEIRADILALEKETEGLLFEIVGSPAT